MADKGESHGRHRIDSLYNILLYEGLQVPHGLGVRIPDSHSGGPGSIPGAGGLFDFSTLFRDVKPGILVAIFTNTFAKGPKVGNLEKNEEST